MEPTHKCPHCESPLEEYEECECDGAIIEKFETAWDELAKAKEEFDKAVFRLFIPFMESLTKFINEFSERLKND